MKLPAVCILLLGLYTPVLAASSVEEDEGPSVQRITESHGYHRDFFCIEAGSEAATALFDAIPAPGTTLRTHRVTIIRNPNPDFELYIASWPFNFNDAFDAIPESSGTLTTYGHQPIWVRYPPGASSGPVRGQNLWN